MTPMQYVTGQRADKAIQRSGEVFAAEGITRQRIDALVAVASDFCANGVAGKSVTAGLLVDEYKHRLIEPCVLIELFELPPEVLHRVRN